MDLDEFLDFVSNNDEFGLLRARPKISAPTSEEHLVSKFEEISNFVKMHSKEPEDDISNVPEFMLHQRLNAIRANQEQCDVLKAHDQYHLLDNHPIRQNIQVAAEASGAYEISEKKVAPEINSLDDILVSDEFGLLAEPTDSIFEIKNVPTARAEADFVARRKRCENFDDYKDQFKEVQRELADGKRKLFKFKENHLRDGGYFILDGVLLYLESIDAQIREEQYASGSRTRQDGRTYIIFENGTESNMLFRSLYKLLLQNGKSVSETNDESLAMFDKNLSGVTKEDQPSGYIYILRSLSEDPEISSIENLYKIGYSTTLVEKRIANAEQQATYLMAPVEHIASYQCFNLDAQKFENLIHTFFGNACLEIEVVDGAGKVCKPREWFIAPVDTIEQAINLLIKGNIVNYRYDRLRQCIVEVEG